MSDKTDAVAQAREAVYVSVAMYANVGANYATDAAEKVNRKLDALIAAVRAECADTKRLDWLEKMAKDGELSEWEAMWYASLNLRAQVDAALEAK